MTYNPALSNPPHAVLSHERSEESSARRIPAYAVVGTGGLLLGTWDLLFARIYWSSSGVSFVDVLQSVASGIYGKASHLGGTKTAIVGAVCHYLIAMCMVSAYFVASRYIKALVRWPWPLGFAYGVFLYYFMNLVVVPLSAIGHPVFGTRSWMGWSIVMHSLFGILCAFTARFALTPNTKN